LALVAGRTPIVIEVKISKSAKRVGKALPASLEGYKGDYVVQSYDPLFLRWLSWDAPSIRRGRILGKPDSDARSLLKKAMNGRKAFFMLSRSDFLVLDIENLDQDGVERLISRGWILLGFTIKGKSVYEKLKSLFDNLVFEGFKP